LLELPLTEPPLLGLLPPEPLELPLLESPPPQLRPSRRC
jgi:hypothetical protein